MQTTGSVAKTGLVSAALLLGSVLPSVLDGPVAARIAFKRVSVAADLISAVIVRITCTASH